MNVTPTLLKHIIYVWELNWSNYLNQKVFLWGLLSPLEREKARQFLCYSDQDQYIVIKGILRLLISRLVDIAPNELIFKHNFFGKPILIDRLLEFNLSHAKDQVVYAFCKTAPLGIDIEYVDFSKPIDKLAQRYFSQRENDILASLKDHYKKEAFFSGWTQKEAIVKNLGFGLQLPLSQVEVALGTKNLQCINLPNFLLEHLSNLKMYSLEVQEAFKGCLVIQAAEQCELKYYREIKF